MDGFEVGVAAVRAAGDAGGAVAGVLRGLDLRGAASSIGDAMPGGAAERAANDLQVAWVVTRERLVDGMQGHADAMIACAEDYAGAEEGIAAALTTALPGSTGPR